MKRYISFFEKSGYTILTGFLLISCVHFLGSDNIELPEVGSEYNQTDSSIGGGRGYQHIVLEKQATVVVRGIVELKRQLAKAQPGTVVFIPGNVQMDLSGEKPLEIPAGVTLASDRGNGGSVGALLYSNDLNTRRMFEIKGDDIRITGLRLRGPDGDVGDPDDGRPTSRGIFGEGYDNIEIDNCELSEWSFSAIMIRNTPYVHIHHNYIHHNRRDRLGYGVALYGQDSTFALVEANLFKKNRHSIAGSGELGVSYEARYNYVTQNTNSHSFDMHGDHENPGSGTRYAGNDTYIHHNTFNITNEGVVIRGIPRKTARIVNNNFARTAEDVAIRQRYYFGNMFVADNQFKDKHRGWYVSWRGKNPWYRFKGDPGEVGLENTVVGDFNGDRKADLLVFDGDDWYVLLDNTKDFRRLNLKQGAIAQSRGNLHLGDFSGDGKTELLKLENNRLYYASYTAQDWQYAGDLDPKLNSEYLKVGDFDGDGKADLFGSDGTSWYVAYGAKDDWQKVNEQRISADQIVVADFTGDGKDNIMVAAGSGWRLFDLTSGRAESAFENVSISSEGFRPARYFVGDFDGDGTADLLTFSNEGLYVNSKAQGIWENIRELDRDVEGIKVGDFDGDSVSDILIYSESLW